MFACIAALLASGTLARCASLGAPAATPPQQYIVLEKTGGFAVGGRRIVENGTGETLSCDHGYAEYFIPATTASQQRRQTSFLLMHSSSTQVYQNRWDGGPGFKDQLLRRGYPVFLLDQPGVGRAMWPCTAPDPASLAPRYLDHWNFETWNFGPLYGEWWADTQFPLPPAAAAAVAAAAGNGTATFAATAEQLERDDPTFRRNWDQAMRARYFKPNSTRATILAAEAVAAGVDGDLFSVAAALAPGQGNGGTRTQSRATGGNGSGGGVVVVTDAAAGVQAMLAAVHSSAARIRAIVAFESIGYVFPEGNAPNGTQADVDPGPYGPFVVPLPDFMKLVAIPIVVFWSHNRAESEKYVVQSRQVAKVITQLGGNAEVVMLDDVGLPGSTHVTIADMDNEALVGLVERFLEKNKLDVY